MKLLLYISNAINDIVRYCRYSITSSKRHCEIW